MCAEYYDLRIPLETPTGDGKDTIKSRLLRAAKLGYRVVAVDVRVHQDDLAEKAATAKKSKRAKIKEAAPEPVDFPEPPKLPLIGENTKDLKVLTRLSIAFKDNSFLPLFNRSLTAPSYDLLALCPASGAALQALLKTGFRADLVEFDLDNPGAVRWTRKLYRECVDKHLRFEICYAPMIRDASARRRTISQAHTYFAVGKSKNVVLSSGAQASIELRGPQDVSNLGFILGLNEQQGKMSVTRCPAESVTAAKGRKLGPYRAKVSSIKDLKEEDTWMVPSEGDDIQTVTRMEEDD